MNKKILTIGYEIPGRSNDFLELNSKKSLMDADTIVFSPKLPYYEKSSINGGYYQGKICYNENGSFKLNEDSNHWNKELENALFDGKTVFLLLSKKEDFFIDTGNRNYSGTGINRSATISVANSHNYKSIPIHLGKITSATGNHIEFTGNNLFNEFFKTFKENFEYQVYLENVDNAQIIFTGKSKTKILGAIYNVKNGHLIALPYINYDDSKFVRYDKTKNESYWTKEAMEFGNNLVRHILELDQKLTQKSLKTPTPKWATNKQFSTYEELKLEKSITDNTKKIETLKNSQEKLNKALEKEQALKDLLFEQNDALENAVIEALKILGYKAENYNDGELELDQVITSPEGHRFIGESEGKDNKDINITKFRQLLESLNADFAREEVEEKAFGILFGNPQRLKNPTERALDFTEKCKIGADREKVALVKTVDLFTVAKYLKENKNKQFQKSCRNAIFQGLGKIVEFPNIPQNKK